jgi:serine protease Do
MTAATTALSHRLRPLLAAICLGAAGALVSAAPAFARGPEGIADVAERVIDAVVNISTSQTVEAKSEGHGAAPQLPQGSPFEEFFDDFFKNRKAAASSSTPPASW